MIYFKITISTIIHNFTSEKKRILISSEVDLLVEKKLKQKLGSNLQETIQPIQASENDDIMIVGSYLYYASFLLDHIVWFIYMAS